MDSPGIAFDTSAAVQERITPSSMAALEKRALKQPFSALHTGKEASGVNRKAGAAWPAR